MRSFSARSLVKVIILGVCGALVLGWRPHNAWAPNCTGCSMVFPMMGIARGQSLRLNVAAAQGDSCNAALSFVDTNGIPIGPPTKTVNLAAGQADFLDLPRNLLPGGPPIRVEVRPVVTLTPGPTVPVCVASAETFDQLTGRTWAFYAMPGGPPT